MPSFSFRRGKLSKYVTSCVGNKFTFFGNEQTKKNPDLFDERKPKDIAMEIIRELEFENTDMISKHSIQLHDIGVITFKLHGSWIAKRVEKMFNDGIDTCAPAARSSKSRAALAICGYRVHKEPRRRAFCPQFYYCFLVLGPKQALAGKEERELGFHLVQFTGVIEKACAGLVPNFVCDYLCDLSKSFTSYYSKVRPGKEPILGLYKAAEVVMDKCFDLLGIAPGFSQVEILSSERRGPCRELAETR
ncbi:arginine--tRNA ligase, chloroplastic/mitochondrial [Tanacetum coccineum]